MGIDLTIYIDDFFCASPDFHSYGQERFYFYRDYLIFNQIQGWSMFNERPREEKRVQTYELPLGAEAEMADFFYAKIETDEEGNPEIVKGTIRVDAYGNTLRWCYASDFSNLHPPEDIHPLNAAILSFLKALHARTKILLY
ncbi:MAG: hypothetical protein KDJ52_35145, partial [Anaerolineae bacterium]|nr:hypothetical protein [Anaerolineae bacterium]